MDFLPPFVILLAAFVDGEALVQIITDPRALSMPTLTGQQLRGFALASVVWYRSRTARDW